MSSYWKRPRVWAMVFALFVMAWVTAGFYLVIEPPDKVTLENYRMINLGMTEAEVRAILGKPWDDSLLEPEEPYTLGINSPIGELDYYTLPGSMKDCYPVTRWYGKEMVIGAVFNFNHRLIDKRQQSIPEQPLYRPRSSVSQTCWRRLCKRLGL